jgi:hypothetical protein
MAADRKRWTVIGAAAACLVISGYHTVFAQSTWNLDTDGNWNVAENWTPNGVPNSNTADVVIDNNPDADVTVTLNMDAQVRNLNLDAGDNLWIAGNRTLTMFRTLTNYGLIHVNANASMSTATFHAGDDLLLTGAGSLQLGRSGYARITTAADKTITQQAGHTIAGVGRVEGRLINHGTVRADGSLGTGTELELLTNDKTNNELFEAVSNSTLHINGISVANTNGTIRAKGENAEVRLSGTAAITGGTLETANGGSFTTSGSAAKTLTDVTNLGTFRVLSNTTLAAEGTLTNYGLIHVNANASMSTATFHAGDDLLLTGAGSLQLGRSGYARITTAADKTITQQAGHTIAGVGRVEGRLINHGTVRADGSLGTGTELELLTNDKTNNELFEAVSNSTLHINGISVANTNGTIRAKGENAEVRLSGTAAITGGTLETANGGSFTTSGSAAKTLTDVTNLGTFRVLSNTTLAAEGTLTNYGLIHVNANASMSTATFHAGDDLLLTGAGSLQLGRSGYARITTAADKTITQQAGHTIAGVGEIDGCLTNHGTVRADASLGNGSVLRVSGGALANYNSATQTLTGGTYEVVGSSTMRLVDGVSELWMPPYDWTAPTPCCTAVPAAAFQLWPG